MLVLVAEIEQIIRLRRATARRAVFLPLSEIPTISKDRIKRNIAHVVYMLDFTVMRKATEQKTAKSQSFWRKCTAPSFFNEEGYSFR